MEAQNYMAYSSSEDSNFTPVLPHTNGNIKLNLESKTVKEASRMPLNLTLQGGHAFRSIVKEQVKHLLQIFPIGKEVTILDLREHLGLKCYEKEKKNADSNIKEDEDLEDQQVHVKEKEVDLKEDEESVLKLKNLLGLHGNWIAEDVLRRAQEDERVSYGFVKSIQLLEESVQKKLEEELLRNMRVYIMDRNVSYYVKHLMKVKEALREKVSKIAISNLSDMLSTSHSSRIVYALYKGSASFRHQIDFQIKCNLILIVQKLAGAVLVSLMISLTDDLTKLSFIVDAVRDNPEILKMKYFSRAFATYLNRCSNESLDAIVPYLLKHVQFLLHDNFGNYLLQILFDRNSKTGTVACKAALLKIHKKVLLRKYSRYVLLKAVVHDSTGEFCKELAEKLFKDPSGIQSIILKKVSNSVLLLCLSKIEDKKKIEQYLGKIDQLGEGLGTMVQSIPQSECLVAEFYTNANLLRRFIHQQISTGQFLTH